MKHKYETLYITSSAFENNSKMPKKYTGYGDDISPELKFDNLSPDAVSIAIAMDDLDIPMVKAYNHWLAWNIPALELIPENIPYGPVVPSLGNAKQGIGYGKNRYRGPKPPAFVKQTHRYVFRVYVLDCLLDIDSNAKKSNFLDAIEDHIIQYGSILGTYQNEH